MAYCRNCDSYVDSDDDVSELIDEIHDALPDQLKMHPDYYGPWKLSSHLEKCRVDNTFGVVTNELYDLKEELRLAYKDKLLEELRAEYEKQVDQEFQARRHALENHKRVIEKEQIALAQERQAFIKVQDKFFETERARIIAQIKLGEDI